MSEHEAEALADELRAVCALLEDALNELYAPLSDLARASLRASEPPVRALAVLATGVRDNEEAALRERRILLAAALEMLAVALQIHGLLLGAAVAGASSITAHGAATPQSDTQSDKQSVTHELDRSLAGSTILTGDYCFSRAAVLAAQTNSATVVSIFSQALKNVSEARLRSLFGSAAATGASYTQAGADQESVELVRAGVRGAAHMAALAPAQEQSARLLAETLATGGALPGTAVTDPALTAQQYARWQAAWRIATEGLHHTAP